MREKGTNMLSDGEDRKVWAKRREALERQDFRNWCQGTNGFWMYRIKHEAILALGALLKASGFFKYGYRNARDLTVREVTVSPPGLPKAFRGYRILHLSDLHLDSMEGTGERIARVISSLSYDLCAITGDFRYARHGGHRQVLPDLRAVLSRVNARDGVFAVLGNHDTFRMVEDFEREGIDFLTNQTTLLSRNGEEIRLVGIDDPHDYYTREGEVCLKGSGRGFKILLAHTPEVYRTAAAAGVGLYLCGHSHGGQICLPGGAPLMTYLDQGKRFYRGVWRYGEMIGHTSPGIGTAKIPVRFNSPPEITLLTLV